MTDLQTRFYLSVERASDLAYLALCTVFVLLAAPWVAIRIAFPSRNPNDQEHS